MEDPNLGLAEDLLLLLQKMQSSHGMVFLLLILVGVILVNRNALFVSFVCREELHYGIPYCFCAIKSR